LSEHDQIICRRVSSKSTMTKNANHARDSVNSFSIRVTHAQESGTRNFYRIQLCSIWCKTASQRKHDARRETCTSFCNQEPYA